jgi:hypothetical protein
MSVSLALLKMFLYDKTWSNISYDWNSVFCRTFPWLSVPALPVQSLSLIKLKFNCNCDYIILLFKMFQLFQNMLFYQNVIDLDSVVGMIVYIIQCLRNVRLLPPFSYFLKSCLSLIGSLIPTMGWFIDMH